MLLTRTGFHASGRRGGWSLLPPGVANHAADDAFHLGWHERVALVVCFREFRPLVCHIDRWRWCRRPKRMDQSRAPSLAVRTRTLAGSGKLASTAMCLFVPMASSSMPRLMKRSRVPSWHSRRMLARSIQDGSISSATVGRRLCRPPRSIGRRKRQQQPSSEACMSSTLIPLRSTGRMWATSPVTLPRTSPATQGITLRLSDQTRMWMT
jgi:hypothetical protein